MYYSRTPPSPTSVGSSISEEDPIEHIMGDIVPLTGPVIRPCQGRPKISDGEVKEVTARNELKEISRCMEKQDCYTPPLHQDLWGQAFLVRRECWYKMSSGQALLSDPVR